MDNYIKLGKKYKSLNILCMLAFLFAFVIVCVLSIKLWLKIMLLLMVVFVFYNVMAFIGKQVNNILFKECNPEKYYCVSKIVHNDTIIPSSIAAISALGDFNRAIALLKAELSKHSGKNKKLSFNIKLLYIECLFTTGEYEACIKEIADFRMKSESSELMKEMNKYNLKVCSFFESFICKNYEKCISILSDFRIDELKYNNLFKCTINYFFAISYYYSGNTEKAKAYFEKIKDVNKTLYYSKKAREYIETINENRFSELNFDEFPKYENGEIDAEANKKENKKVAIKAVLAFVFLVALIISVCFLISDNKKGTAQEVISYSVGFDVDIKAILPVEEADAAICVFENTDDFDYFYVAYLEDAENGLYTYGIEHQLNKDELFAESFDDYEYFFGSGKKDLNIVFKIVRSEEEIPDHTNAESFVYTMKNGKEKTYYIYVVHIEKENIIGYSTGIY